MRAHRMFSKFGTFKFAMKSQTQKQTNIQNNNNQ